MQPSTRTAHAHRRRRVARSSRHRHRLADPTALRLRPTEHVVADEQDQIIGATGSGGVDGGTGRPGGAEGGEGAAGGAPSITSAKMVRSSSVEPAAASPGATGGSNGVGAGGKRDGEAGGASELSVARQQPVQLQLSPLRSSHVKETLSSPQV